MSLINQMLRDLEQRTPPTNAAAPADPTNIPLMREPMRPRTHHAAWLIGIAGLTAAGWLVWDRLSQWNSAPTPAVVKVKAPAITNTENKEPTIAASKQVSEQQTLIKTEAPSAQITSAHPLPAESPSSPLESALVSEKAPLAKAALPNAKTSKTPSASKPIKSQKSSADALFRQAENSASRMMQKEYLKEVLEIDPRHLPARSKLLSILLRERSTLELKRFLDDSLALFPTHLGFINALAHYHVQQRDFSSAIATLEQIDSFAINDTQYLGLLAASYQQQHLYAKALPIYQKLSQIQADKAENWLGLGICAEKLHQPSSAAQAYRRALQGNGLSSAVVDYIKQRLSALND